MVFFFKFFSLGNKYNIKIKGMKPAKFEKKKNCFSNDLVRINSDRYVLFQLLSTSLSWIFQKNYRSQINTR